MAYLAPIHRPSSVRHALKLRFIRPDEDCLVVAKANILEFYNLSGNGVTLEHSRTIYGKISMLQKFRPVSSPADHLFVGTDRQSYFTVSWDATARQLRTERSYVDLMNGGARESQSGGKCLMDPGGRHLVLELLEGILTVIPIIQARQGRKKVEGVGNLGDPVPARIPELFVRSATFLHGTEKPRLALLWEDGHRKVHLRTKDVDYTPGTSSEPGTVELTDTEFVMPNVPDQGASHLISLSDPSRGLIVIGESTILYVNDETNEQVHVNLEDATIFVAWEQIAATRFVLADDYGRLFQLNISIDGGSVRSLDILPLGNTSRASTLISLTENFIFVGSHQGDSQVIRIDSQPPGVEVTQTIANIAPILDFTIMDLGNRAGEGPSNEYSSGQARIVTGSGAFQDGSLRSVRSGVGLEDQGILGEMEGIRAMFGLWSSGSGPKVDTLVVSFIDETRAFRFSAEGEVEELEEYKGLSLGESTLVATNLRNDRIIQATPSAVRLIDAEGGTLMSNWSPPAGKSITAASSNNDWILLSVGGVGLVVLDIQSELAIKAQTPVASDSQIACVTVPSQVSSICLVGYWQSAAVSVLKIDTLETLHTEVVGDVNGGSIPREIIMTQILPEKPPTLLIALADGVVCTFSVDLETFALSAKNSVVLGTQQANFQELPRGDGLYNVFATCEHPSVIYGSEGRLVYSAVTAEKATCVCSFDSDAYPDAIMVATPKELKLALIDQERRTHVRKLPLGETARRVAYSPKLKAFAVGTIERKLVEGTEEVKSHLKLVDEVVFDALDTFELNNDELVESVIRAELDDGFEETVERFVVGTGYLDDSRDDSIRGRIMVFAVNEDRKLRLMAELAVVIYSLEQDSGIPTLVKRTSYRTSTAPIDIAVVDNLIAIADLMKSVSIVEYREGEGGLSDTLKEVARHFLTSWSTAVAHVADDTFLESDAEGNLMVLHQNRNGVTEDDRRRLQVTGEMLLGEMVNRIRRINVPLSSDAVVVPRAFLATVEGSIYLFALISPGKQDLLMRLQSNMAKYIQSPGQMPFNRYRAFKSSVREAEEPFRFVDGEMIEKFLDCSDSLQEEIVEGLNVDLDAVRSMIEGLRRLR
ncbi:MAG: hypothetical protein M1833_006969 [Piccolia ochrophora]|nr:MAG: hypothetical protein M1833_006969 [Piccolia ochrophora]